MESKVIKSDFPSPAFPTDVSILQFLRKDVDEETRNKTFRIDCATGTSYTFGQTLDLALRLGSALRSCEFGLPDRSHVVLLLPNVAEYFSIFAGVTEANMVAILINPEYSECELEAMLRGIQVHAVVTMPKYVDRFRAVTKNSQEPVIITIGQVADGCQEFFDLVKRYEPCESPVQSFDSNQTAYILFSSGTTGVPKGVELSHRNAICQIEPAANIMGGRHGDETFYSVFPPYHAAGLMMVFVAFFNRWKAVASSEKFSVQNLITNFKKFKPTILGLPPTVISIICSCDDLGGEDFWQLKTIIYGGSPLGDTLAKKLLWKLGSNVATLAVYGCSESTSICTLQPMETATPNNSSVGKVISHAEMKTISTTTGAELGANESGEICFRGPQVFKGYINNIEAYRQTVDPAGWLRTGDFGYYDEQCTLYITGRIKDLIKVNANQVSPDEIENVIRKHDQVEEVVVFGVPDPKTQEAPRALIVAKTATLTENEIHDFLKDKLIGYKQLRGGIRFVKSIPVTSGARKLNRKAAKAMDEAMEKGTLTE